MRKEIAKLFPSTFHEDLKELLVSHLAARTPKWRQELTAPTPKAESEKRGAPKWRPFDESQGGARAEMAPRDAREIREAREAVLAGTVAERVGADGSASSKLSVQHGNYLKWFEKREAHLNAPESVEDATALLLGAPVAPRHTCSRHPAPGGDRRLPRGAGL